MDGQMILKTLNRLLQEIYLDVYRKLIDIKAAQTAGFKSFYIR